MVETISEEMAQNLLGLLANLNHNVVELGRQIKEVKKIPQTELSVGDIHVSGNFSLQKAKEVLLEIAELNTIKQENHIKKIWGGIY